MDKWKYGLMEKHKIIEIMKVKGYRRESGRMAQVKLGKWPTNRWETCFLLDWT